MSPNMIERRIQQVTEYRGWARRASDQTDKSMGRQLREISELRKMGGQCGITDYYWFKMYDDSYQQGRGPADYLGWKLDQSINAALNTAFGQMGAEDKLTFYALGGVAGLPMAPVLAAYHPAEGITPYAGRHLRTVPEVAEFLKDPSIYPLFVKPSFSQQGFGARCLVGYRAEDDQLLELSGKTVPLAEVLRMMTVSVDPRFHKPQCGCLFQPMLKPAPEIRAFNQWSAICGARIVCLNGPDGVVPIRAVWKVAVQPNPVDNFNMGANGNLLADIDLETGELRRLIGGFWPHTQVMDKHPKTGQPLAGLRLPGWHQALDACRRAGPVFPLVQIQHWDFAFTDQGPVILELNGQGGTQIPQLHGAGLLTPVTREFLKTHGDVKHQPWIHAL
jgi:hypothetical protein